MIGWIVGLTIAAGAGIGGWIGWSSLMKEHEEARNIPLADLDFSRLKTGNFHGSYAGGMYGWRANDCDVKVEDGKVTDIQLTGSKDPAKENMQSRELYQRVIDVQSLQVDTISSATLTSKAYLKALENALVQASN
jgi:uncharacterized protein with FMN-binding domain